MAALLAATELAEARAQEDARGVDLGLRRQRGGDPGGLGKRRAQRELYFDRLRASSSAQTDEDEDGGDQDEGDPVDVC